MFFWWFLCFSEFVISSKNAIFESVCEVDVINSTLGFCVLVGRDFSENVDLSSTDHVIPGEAN